MIALADLGVAAYLVERCDTGAGYVYLEINAAAAALWSGEPGRQLGPMRLDEAFPPEAAARIAASFAACLDGQKVVERDSTLPVPHGTITVRTALYPLARQPGQCPRLLGIVTDLTPERRLREELNQSNARLAMAIEALGGAHWFFDAARRCFELSPGFARVLEERFRPVMTLDEWLACVHPDDRHGPSFADQLNGLKEEDTKEFRVQTERCAARWLRCHRRPVRNEWSIIGVAGVIIDITADRERELVLNVQASTDVLTGLGNRRRLQEVLAAAADNEALPLALLMIDVDHFKLFNDRYGHPAGDEVLKRISGVLQSLVEPMGGAAIRYGGEEFVVVLPGVDAGGARCAAAAIVANVTGLAHHHAASEHGIVTVSIGGAARSVNGTDLLTAADGALYRAKRAGRNGFRMAEGGVRGPPQPLRPRQPALSPP